jgi:hypothetical protein
VRFHVYSALLWRCQNLELENGGPRVVRPGILVSPFRCVGRAPSSADTHRMRGCFRHSYPNAALFQVLLCLPTAQRLLLQGNGDFGTSAFFGQLSDKPLLACIWSHGVRAPKRNGCSKIKRWAPSWRAARQSIGSAVGRRERFEFNRAAWPSRRSRRRVRPEGERMFQLLISLIGAVVPI